MNDSNFDDFLSDVISDTDAANKKVKINPWQTSMRFISIGLLLMMIILNFLGLNYVLPPVGIAMIYCGTRTLKKENKFFFAAWILSGILAVDILYKTVLLATPYYSDDILIEYPIENVVFLGMLCALHFAFEKVFAKAEIHQKRTPFLFAAIWEIFIILASLSGVENFNFFIGVALIVTIVLIIRSIYKLQEILPKFGYDFLLSKPRISSKTAIIAYLCLCFVLTFATVAYFDHTVNEATDFQIDTSLSQRQELLEKGFPKEIINDITDEDIKLISDCDSVLYHGSGFKYDDKPLKSEGKENKVDPRSSSEILPLLKVHLQKEDSIFILEYFDLSQLRSRRNSDFDIWFGGSDTYNPYLYPHSGNLIYEKDGKTKIADVAELRNVTDIPYLGFLVEGRQEIAGKICYPFGAENERGYILYEFDKNVKSGFMTCFDYYVDPYSINYPYSTTLDGTIGRGRWVRQNSFNIYGYQWENNKILDYIDYPEDEYY